MVLLPPSPWMADNVSLTQLKFGSYDAVAHFNIGKRSYILIYQRLGMIPGRYMTKQCSEINKKRLYFGTLKSNVEVCKRRKVISVHKKSAIDKSENIEGTLYEPGVF
jgi:hypothetical protein